jgi:glycosyltransferase involved in cell wall biosynthesis
MRMAGGQMAALADRIEDMIKTRPWVKFHGMVTKRELMAHFQQASVWIYPANFIETFCITAWEALAAGVWPIVRDMGALKYTMKDAIAKGMCEVLDTDCETDAEVQVWAERVVEAVKERKYKRVNVNAHDLSWAKVADAFIKEMGLSA